MNTFAFPFPDSRTAVQAALGDLMLRIGANDIDPRRAGLLLYCLQLAQANLKATELAHQQAQPQSQPDKTAPSEQAPAPTPAGESGLTSGPEGAPGFSPVNDQPTARGFSPGPSNPVKDVQTQLSSFEDFAQKTGEGESNPPNHSQPATRPISRATFAALLESLARHQGINVDDPIYANHNQDSPILAALRAQADNDEIEPKLTLHQLTARNLQLTTPLVILNHSNAKQTNRSHHPRRLGLPRRDARKRHRSSPQAKLRQASGDVSKYPHPRQ